MWKGLAGDIRPALKCPALKPLSATDNSRPEHQTKINTIRNQTGPPEQAALLLVQSLYLIPGTKKTGRPKTPCFKD